MTYDYRHAAGDKDRVLRIVRDTLARNKGKWDWIEGFSDAQLERLAKNTAANIEKELRKMKGGNKIFSDDIIASFVANLSRAHAGFIANQP